MTYLLSVITTCVLFYSAVYLIELSVKRAPVQVIVSRTFSSPLEVIFGVPSRICLGSLLFSALLLTSVMYLTTQGI